jgi:hypothetical protein
MCRGNPRQYKSAQTEQPTLPAGACRRHLLLLCNNPRPVSDTPDQAEFFRAQNVDSTTMFGIPLSNPA